MKQALRKIERGGLLREYILFGCFVLFSGGLLLVQITKIADRGITAADSTRFIVLSVMIFIIIVAWAGVSLYRKSMSYILWYREMLDALPTPIVVTDEGAQWQHINKAMRETMDIKETCDINKLHSRHLINMDGSIKSKVWLHKGEQYQVAGGRLCCDGKNEGYLIYLNGEKGISESARLQTEMMVKVNRCIKRLSVETGYFRDCTSNISRGMFWQSGLIIELFQIIDELAANGVCDQSALIERINGIRADMRRQTEKNQAELDRIQQLVSDLNSIRDVDAS